MAVAELKFADGVKVITPAAEIFTVPLVTGIVCAPPVRVVPPIDVILNVSPSRSESNANGFKVTVASSATV
ncbi:hypothetical protein D3C86_2241380 [compost metagenome]